MQFNTSISGDQMIANLRAWSAGQLNSPTSYTAMPVGLGLIERVAVDRSGKFMDVYWSAETPKNWYEFMRRQQREIVGFMQTHINARVAALCTDRLNSDFYCTQLVIHSVDPALEN